MSRHSWTATEVAIGALVVAAVIWFAVAMWNSGKNRPTSLAGTTTEQSKLRQYERWGESLHSRDPQRMREALREMQREGFSEKDIEEYKRLRGKYGR